MISENLILQTPLDTVGYGEPVFSRVKQALTSQKQS